MLILSGCRRTRESTLMLSKDAGTHSFIARQQRHDTQVYNQT
uniref:Uncharacterized protein n=2 Tax=Anguilla anguilla TaxID=7936 RepID=A0A0E9UGC7_ANGAN